MFVENEHAFAMICRRSGHQDRQNALECDRDSAIMRKTNCSIFTTLIVRYPDRNARAFS